MLLLLLLLFVTRGHDNNYKGTVELGTAHAAPVFLSNYKGKPYVFMEEEGSETPAVLFMMNKANTVCIGSTIIHVLKLL